MTITTFNLWLAATYRDNKDRTQLEKDVATLILKEEDSLKLVGKIALHALSGAKIQDFFPELDSHAFFDAHYNDMWPLVREFEQLPGDTLDLEKQEDLKDFLTWFAFEFLCHQIDEAWSDFNEGDES